MSKPTVVIVRGACLGTTHNASNQKAVALAQALQRAGCRAYVIGRMCRRRTVRKFCHLGGVVCHNPPVSRRPKRWSLWLARLQYPLRAAGYVWQLARRRKVGAIIIEEQPLMTALALHLAARLRGLRIIYNLEEWYAVHPGTSPLLARRLRLEVRLRLGWSDAALVISRFIADRVREIVPGKPVLVLPALAKFSPLTGDDRSPLHDDRTFLFCGSTAYSEVISAILQAYGLLVAKEPTARLSLLLTGSAEVIAALRREAAAIPGDIVILENRPNAEVLQHGRGAFALLAPLRAKPQDEARFPQKLAEYASTGRPIITNRVGDVELYFEDGDSAVFAAGVAPAALAAAMAGLCADPARAEAIGRAGWAGGRRHFDLHAYATPLAAFVLGQPPGGKGGG